MRPRYTPPPRPKREARQPSADDQALARITRAVAKAIHKRAGEIEGPHKVDWRLWERGDFEGLAVDAMAAHDKAVAIEKAREDLNDRLDDLPFA